MELLDVYGEDGERCAAAEDQQELYVVAGF